MSNSDRVLLSLNKLLTILSICSVEIKENVNSVVIFIRYLCKYEMQLNENTNKLFCCKKLLVDVLVVIALS